MANIKELIQSIESGDSSFDEKLAAINKMEETLVAMREQEKEAVDDNVELIVEAIKLMEKKVADQLEIAKSIVPEKGDKGDKGKDGLQGRDGLNGKDGRDGRNGLDGKDGEDGVSVTDAKIDFDGSLVITLSTGREINVGEVVAPDLAERLSVISTMSTNTAVANITSGTIDGTVIGGTTPAASTFTTLTATGQTSLGGVAGSESLRVITQASAVNRATIRGGTSSSPVAFGADNGGTGTSLNIYNSNGQPILFTTNGFYNVAQFNIAHTASAVNYVQVTGAATTPTLAAVANITFTGSDTNVAGALVTKGSSTINFAGSGASGVVAFGVSTSNASQSGNSIQAEGSGAGQVPLFRAISNRLGSDANISMAFQPKGTGAIDLAAGSSGVNISNGGTVTAITRTAQGSGYTSTPSVAITAPTTAGGVQATATALMIAFGNSPTITSGGTGYTVSDVLTVTGGTFASAVTITVTSVSGGVITGANYANFGNYTVLPTNPVSVTGGTGSGATFTISWGVNAYTITNAGSGYVEQPTVTFSGGGGSGAAAYATVGSAVTLKSIGGTLDLQTTNGIGFRIYDSGGSIPSSGYWAASSGTSSPFLWSRGGTNTPGLITSSGTGAISIQTNSGSQTQFVVAHTASAVNYVQVTGAATGGVTQISAQGSDSTTYTAIGVKGGSGYISFFNGGSHSSANTLFRVLGTGVTQANYPTVTPAAASASPVFGVAGSDTNIDLSLTPKGTGNVRFGTYTGTILTPTGYVEIKDSGGTVRRLLVG